MANEAEELEGVAGPASGLAHLQAIFANARRAQRAVFMPYLVIGHPDVETSLALVEALAAAGADLFELGVPFSDPLADGPVIQKATQHALEQGVTMRTCLAAARELAQVLQTCAGSNNQVFRYSGDEFLVLTRLIEEDQVTKLARSIQAAVARQFKYKHHTIQITVSIGICLDEPYNLDQIILNADIALYVAKQTRNTVTCYRPSMVQARTRAEILAADLSTALGKNEFEL